MITEASISTNSKGRLMGWSASLGWGTRRGSGDRTAGKRQLRAGRGQRVRAGTPSDVRRDGRDYGSVALEVVVLAPVILALLAVLAYAGRLQAARADVEAAAQSAARTISIARDPYAAIGDAQADATATAGSGEPCDSLTLTATVGEDAVTVELSCVLPPGELTRLIPIGPRTITGGATEPRDVWREEP